MTAWSDWAGAVDAGVRGVPDALLAECAARLRGARIILTAGNGGSHALASHAAQALMKPDYRAGGGAAAICLSDAVPTLTAHANDGGWASALEEIARPVARAGDAVWIFSSSGRSENVVRLARLAAERGCLVIAFTGFDGGELRRMADIAIHVASDDYEVIEPVHDALLHRVQHHLRTTRGIENAK